MIIFRNNCFGLDRFEPSPFLYLQFRRFYSRCWSPNLRNQLFYFNSRRIEDMLVLWYNHRRKCIHQRSVWRNYEIRRCRLPPVRRCAQRRSRTNIPKTLEKEVTWMKLTTRILTLLPSAMVLLAMVSYKSGGAGNDPVATAGTDPGSTRQDWDMYSFLFNWFRGAMSNEKGEYSWRRLK